MVPDAAGQFFNPYAYGGDPINGIDPDGNLFGWDDLAVGIIGGAFSYVGGGLNNGDWFNATALYNVYNGASSAVGGYNVGLVTTAATGGCFVCGYAAGSLAASGISSLNGMAANAISGGGVGSPNATLGVGPASYTFGGDQGGGFNFSTPNKWDSPADIFNSSMTALSYAGAAGSVYGTYGSFERGTLGFQNPFTTNSQWSLMNGDGQLSLRNFKNQSNQSFQAANASVQDAYGDFKKWSGFDLKLDMRATNSGIRGEDLRMTETVLKHTDRPFYNSSLTMDEIMRSGPGSPDPGGFPGGLRWDAPGAYNGSSGTWQFVVDPAGKRVLHFNFVRPKY